MPDAGGRGELALGGPMGSTGHATNVPSRAFARRCSARARIGSGDRPWSDSRRSEAGLACGGGLALATLMIISAVRERLPRLSDGKIAFG